MTAAKRLLQQLRQPGHAYMFLVCLTGVLLLLTTGDLSIFSYSSSDWIMIYALVGAILILVNYTFYLPPAGNGQSMDSSVYLAVVFAFGGGLALFVLLISSVIFAIYKRSIQWWKHLLNFTMYTMMIIGANFTYHLLGGRVGSLNVHNLYPYILSLAVYFCINVLVVGLYYFILYKGKLFDILKSFFRDTLFAYLSTLLLSIVLVILIVNNHVVGLFLFLAIGMLLSHAFRQLFLMYNEMSDKANNDQRTGLYNHSYFEQKLDEYTAQARTKDSPLSLAMLDLDDFKKYNDAFGHLQGDRLLGFFGKILKSECETLDLFVARYGGEEFAIILPNFTKEKAKEFINGLRKKVNDTPFEGVDVFPHGCISFSAGILEISKESYDKSQLVDWADRALYVAKSKGKNTVSIYGERSNLPQRLEHDSNEIEQQIKFFLSKDVYTFKHSKRVFSYAVDMAEMLNLNEEERRILVLGALIHDIGKLEVPRDILNKKTKLTNEEWEIVKKHVVWGKEIVLATMDKYKDVVPLVELHHERFDGKGYPHGLAGQEIPRLARMLCIIDSFDAMTTERPYQATKSFPEALKELHRCSGSQFDPELTGYFVQYIEEKMRNPA